MQLNDPLFTEFSLIKRGRKNVMMDSAGFTYSFDRGNIEGEKTWRCSKYRTLDCKARVKTKGKLIIQTIIEHCHQCILQNQFGTLNRTFNMIPGHREGIFNVQDEHGFVYTKDHQLADGSSTWTCKRRNAFKCRSVIKIHGDLILWQRRTHNHDPLM